MTVRSMAAIVVLAMAILGCEKREESASDDAAAGDAIAPPADTAAAPGDVGAPAGDAGTLPGDGAPGDAPNPGDSAPTGDIGRPPG